FFLAVSALFFLPAASEYRSFFLNQNSTAAYALSVFALSLGKQMAVTLDRQMPHLNFYSFLRRKLICYKDTQFFRLLLIIDRI
ncbi:MAG: hypothetical protein II138_03910, partial [Paludibacteraceae bacterium]|nr:hypothetical protein [Paludibacteraceae bacterium]